MLKVLYDAANEAADAGQSMENTDGLFDDDDDEEATLSGTPGFTRNNTFASLDNDHGNPSTVSWSILMKKMKAEIKDIEYAQVPTLTSTRKIDLNQPFSLVPESFDPKTCKRRSLLVGCNYKHLNGAQLKASHDDVRSMKVSSLYRYEGNAISRMSFASRTYPPLPFLSRIILSMFTGFLKVMA